jgi:hypothetical protein
MGVMMKKFLVLVIAVIPMFLQGRYHVVKSASNLENLVEQYRYSLVCFAPSGQRMDEQLDSDEKTDRRHTFRSLQNLVKSASQSNGYKHYLSKDVGFLVVDVASKRAEDVAQEYHVKDQPLCVVFEQGAIDNAKKVMRPATVRDLIGLLEAEGGADLKELLEDRKQDARLDRQERIASYYAYATSPFGYGSSAYGWPGYGYWGGPYARWGLYAGW